jgi:hypothetical protein
MGQANKLAIGVGAVVVGILAFKSYSVKEMSDLSQQTYLRLYGEGMYEYHAQTGKWPSTIDDLTDTSLPQRYPHWWNAQLGLAADVLVAPKELKPDPKQNGHVILCYHNKGLDAERGRIWVCWGDLRTECIAPEALQEQLNKQNSPALPAPKTVGSGGITEVQK